MTPFVGDDEQAGDPEVRPGLQMWPVRWRRTLGDQFL
jgi:hypothetical protein